jgi:predicted Zn-dependent protease
MSEITNIISAFSGGARGSGDAAVAALQAPHAMIQNSLLAHVRTQEDAADRAGALPQRHGLMRAKLFGLCSAANR